MKEKGNMMKKIKILILTTLMIAIAGMAQATKIVTRNLNQQIQDAEYVVRVRVDHIETSKNHRTQFDYNFYHFELLEVLKGWSTKKPIVIRLLNPNNSGHYAFNIPELPHFSVDDELILFLGKANEEGRPTLLGYSTGVYHVYQTNKAAKAVVGNVPLPIGLSAKSKNLSVKKEGQTVKIKTTTLEDFTAYIKDKLNN